VHLCSLITDGGPLPQ